MRDDYIDRKIRKMAESERMAVPESLNTTVENILEGLKPGKRTAKTRMEREQIKRYAIMALDES